MRLLVIGVVVWMIYQALDWSIYVLKPADGSRPWAQIGFLLALLAVYAVLISIPFVPGIEIAVSLMMLRGPELVLPIYIATVLGLLLAYFIGRLTPYRVLQSLAIDLRLVRLGRMIEQITPLPQAERLALLQARLPQWMGPISIKYRYFLLAGLINLPGSSLIGGGGGIMIVAGLTRLFSPRATILTLALAVSPIPLAVWIFGINIMQG